MTDLYTRWKLACDVAPIDLQLLEAIQKELAFAVEKFPRFNSAHEGYAVIKGEVDELWEQVKLKQNTPKRNENMEKEAIQVAAMAIRFINDITRRK